MILLISLFTGIAVDFGLNVFTPQIHWIQFWIIICFDDSYVWFVQISIKRFEHEPNNVFLACVCNDAQQNVLQS